MKKDGGVEKIQYMILKNILLLNTKNIVLAVDLGGKVTLNA